MTKKRILLVEDDSLLRMGLKSMIDMHGEYMTDDDVATGKEALRSFQSKKQDVILLDLRLPDIPGTEVLQRIRKIEPAVKIIVLTASDDNDFIFDALEHGANAYVLKGSNPEELFLAVQYALDDALFISPHLAKVIVRDYLLVNRQRKALPPMQNLTAREKEIVRLIIDGWKSKEIAESLFISIKTVDKHRSNILGKLGINSCNELRHGSLFCQKTKTMRENISSGPDLPPNYKSQGPEDPIAQEGVEGLANTEVCRMQESNLNCPKKTVLVVDDDEICRFVTAEILKNIGLKVDLAANAEQATVLANAKNYDLILLDLHMPSMNGMDLARYLQENGLATEDRICLLTGEEQETVLIKKLAGKSLRILRKPLERSQVISFFSTRTEEVSIEAATAETLKIKGFDMSHALANFLGNESAFFNILREFPGYGAKFISDYSTHLKNKNIKECIRLAHSIKGSSLMIGATEINTLAIALEAACHGASDMQSVDEIFKKMEAIILESSESIRKHFQHDNA